MHRNLGVGLFDKPVEDEGLALFGWRRRECFAIPIDADLSIRGCKLFATRRPGLRILRGARGRIERTLPPAGRGRQADGGDNDADGRETGPSVHGGFDQATTPLIVRTIADHRGESMAKNAAIIRFPGPKP